MPHPRPRPHLLLLQPPLTVPPHRPRGLRHRPLPARLSFSERSGHQPIPRRPLLPSCQRPNLPPPRRRPRLHLQSPPPHPPAHPPAPPPPPRTHPPPAAPSTSANPSERIPSSSLSLQKSRRRGQLAARQRKR